MLQIERDPDGQEALRQALLGWQSGLWTALPGVVVSFDPVKVTVTVQPTIQGVFTDQSGDRQNITLPLLPDVPVVFPRGGGFILTFPVIPGDEVLVVLASRCIDAWWQSSGVQPQFELRMHDLSDGFALPGPFSVPEAVALAGGCSTTATQLRSLDGTASITVAAGVITLAAETININAGTVVNITAPTINEN